MRAFSARSHVEPSAPTESIDMAAERPTHLQTYRATFEGSIR
jgi:hypothetical protein